MCYDDYFITVASTPAVSAAGMNCRPKIGIEFPGVDQKYELLERFLTFCEL